MSGVAFDSLYSRDRFYYLDLVRRQVLELLARQPDITTIIEGLRELSKMTPGLTESAIFLDDWLFHGTLCALLPVIHSAIASLTGECVDIVVTSAISQRLLEAVPVEIRRDPYIPPLSWW
ncbi:hypothetical protein N7491_006450 [Penicillium cf. griseofulvum]|uniref:Uncharacterized protein n=1 Tax=Penicillium cf. griseofulvum TaxID=2972120 RepID=A0A9W9M201_9EURO|nr:hypothetical protein N7472_010519 [Penicillium cf. griseofulvum]KAJ5429434.1 hypothetical protein N7491_006450 [Penicillium cf. griseofulvum]KAJ5436783.1 hypothetical protein N7445_007668 [Penicillium cf. griseofulvum]